MLCHPESRPVRRQRTWKRFTKQTPTDPPGATRKFYSADRGSCPCRMEGSDALTRRCRPMPSLAPRLSARPSPPWGFRPRVPGTDQPFTASLVCGLSRSATSPRAHTAWAGPPLVGSHNLLCRRGHNQRSGIVHWGSYPGLPFTPFKRRPSGTTHLSAMPSACRLLQAARTCTAAMHRLGASGAREPSYCTSDAMH